MNQGINKFIFCCAQFLLRKWCFSGHTFAPAWLSGTASHSYFSRNMTMRRSSVRFRLWAAYRQFMSLLFEQPTWHFQVLYRIICSPFCSGLVFFWWQYVRRHESAPSRHLQGCTITLVTFVKYHTFLVSVQLPVQCRSSMSYCELRNRPHHMFRSVGAAIADVYETGDPQLHPPGPSDCCACFAVL